jgi:hypothetical protein
MEPGAMTDNAPIIRPPENRVVLRPAINRVIYKGGDMRIAQRFHGAGNKTRYEVDYFNWLQEGRTLSPNNGFSAALADGSTVTDVTVDQVSVTSTKLFFWVSGGSINEAFTVQTQVTDTLGEIVNDTVDFTVVAP